MKLRRGEEKGEGKMHFEWSLLSLLKKKKLLGKKEWNEIRSGKNEDCL